MKLLTNSQTAEMLGLRPNTLEIWRSQGRGPVFLKMDPKKKQSPVRYKEADVIAWIEAHTCASTSEYPRELATA